MKINDYKESATDHESFHFNLQSSNLSKPIKYEIKNKLNDSYCLCDNLQDELMFIGVITLRKNDSLIKSEYWCDDNSFDFHSCSQPLGGKKSIEKREYSEKIF